MTFAFDKISQDPVLEIKPLNLFTFVNGKEVYPCLILNKEAILSSYDYLLRCLANTT